VQVFPAPGLLNIGVIALQREAYPKLHTGALRCCDTQILATLEATGMKKNTKGTGHQSSFFYRCSLCAAGGMLMGVAAV